MASQTINDVVGIFLLTIGMSLNGSKLLSLVTTYYANSNKSNDWIVLSELIQLFQFNAIVSIETATLNRPGSPWGENFELSATYQPGKIFELQTRGFHNVFI